MAKLSGERYHYSRKRQLMRYTVILQKEEDGGYVATVPVLPGCVSQGDTRQEALKNIEEAIEVYLQDVRAAGESVPIEDERAFVEVALDR
jgi:predicted RNase H-like HicB family nuclease